jgi:hypothetical protein
VNWDRPATTHHPALIQPTASPYTAYASWKPTPREPAKTKAELREMLAQAVRSTQPQTETEPLPKAKKGRHVAAG